MLVARRGAGIRPTTDEEITMRDRRDDERSFRGPMGMSREGGRDDERFRDHDRDREWERARSWDRDRDMGGSGWSGASGRGGYESRDGREGHDESRQARADHDADYRNEYRGDYRDPFGGTRRMGEEGGYGGGWGGQREHSGMNAYGGRNEHDRQYGRDFDRYGSGNDRGYDSSGPGRSFDRGMRGIPTMGRQEGTMRGSDLGFSYRGHEGNNLEDRGPHYGKGPKGYKRSDDRVREDVCDCIAHQGHIDASDVEVKVENGTVILTGTVGERHHKRALEQMVERLHGVDDVRNELRLKRDEQTQTRSQQSQQNGDQPRSSQMPNGKNARA